MDDAFDEIVASVYQAASGTTEWGAALRSVQRHFDAWLVQLIGYDLTNGGITFSYEAGPAPPEGLLDYVRTWHRHDPRTAPVMQLGDGIWFNDHEQFDEDYVSKSPFYQEYLIPYGGRWVGGVQLKRTSRETVIFAIHRRYGNSPLNAEETRSCTRIAKHLAKAIEIDRGRREVAAEVNLGTELLNRVRAPILLVDDQRGIRHANEAAKAFLAKGDPLVSRSGLLGCRTPGEDANLLAAIRMLPLAGESYLGGASKRDKAFLRIPRSGQDAIGLYLYAVQPQNTMGHFGHQPLAMGIIHDPRARTELDPFVVAAAFDLTPAEARVGVALARGDSVETIAEQYKISIATVRSQLKSVMAKTGTSRQAELVSRLATLPMAALGLS